MNLRQVCHSAADDMIPCIDEVLFTMRSAAGLDAFQVSHSVPTPLCILWTLTYSLTAILSLE